MTKQKVNANVNKFGFINWLKQINYGSFAGRWQTDNLV